MAASIFRISASCSRVKITCFRPVVTRSAFPSVHISTPHQPKPATTAMTTSPLTHQHKSLIHTGQPLSEDFQFKLPKNRKEGADHWKNERIVSVALLAMIPAAYVYPNIVIDHGFAVLAPLHMYWGLNAIIADYCWRPIVPALKAGWLGLAMLSVVGLLYINVNDVGVTKLFVDIMSL